MVKDINDSIENLEIYHLSPFPIIMAQRHIIRYIYTLYMDEHPQIKKLVNAHFKLFADSWESVKQQHNELMEIIGAFCFGSAKRYKYKNLIIS